MDSFDFTKPATGKNFVGHRKELELLTKLVLSGENVAVYGEPGAGKMSLICQMLTKAGLSGCDFITAEVSLMNSRTLEDFVIAFADGIIRSFANTTSGISALADKHLAGTHLVFDKDSYASGGRTVSTNWLMDEVDVSKVLALPSALAEERQSRLIVIVSQFQNVLYPEDSYMLLKSLEEMTERKCKGCSFVFTGSRMNGMKEIFEVRRLFWHSVERFQIAEITPQDVADYINRSFQNKGKVVERELSVDVSIRLRCNMRYINQLFSMVDYLSRGFVTERTLYDSFDMLLALHDRRFFSTMCSLTDFQLRLLEAVTHGETRLSMLSVIDRYRLNSSANVKRLKDALAKKEVLWFDDDDVPHIQDPLFEYWLKNVWYARSQDTKSSTSFM